jgi:hypothetical protein
MEPNEDNAPKPTVLEFCHQSGKCPFLEVSGGRIVLRDKDQHEAGSVSLTVEQATDLIEGLKTALEHAKR